MRTEFYEMTKCIAISCIVMNVVGCTTHGVIKNVPQTSNNNPDNYAISDRLDEEDGTLVILSLSGGGTRAAAFSYGVMQELRDTELQTGNDEPARMLDNIDVISSVSGGSFVAAYYGLYGDDIFEHFEDRFLHKNVQGHLERTMYNPLEWFNRTGRVEKAVKYYQKLLFNDATFADMKRSDGPLIMLNATDLCYGIRFTFVQEYFNLLGSDIATFPVAQAVTASSAVPILFDPVVVQNFPSPDVRENSPWLAALEERTESERNSDLEMLVYGMDSYLDKENHKYIHFVDGGITDNLGLRAIFDMVEMGGGIKAFCQSTSPTKPETPFKRIVVILVNAATHHRKTMDIENKQPHLTEIISSTSHLQLTRYSEATLKLTEDSLKNWTEELSTPEQPVSSYFIHVRFEDEKDPLALKLFNALPTSFTLPPKHIDHLIKGGRELLRNNPDFQQLIKDLQQP
jgi:NTE family protein